MLLPKLLQDCPNLKIIVTSRERLRLEEEWVFPVEGLTLPSDSLISEDSLQFDAVQLFVQRATQAQFNFALTSGTLSHVLKLCRLVEGSPLALELAAVWTKVTPIEALTRDIETNLDTLNANLRNRSERHKSLRAVFEHSWNLLSSVEQEVFKNLTVFRGGFTKEAAIEVADASFDVLISLVDKSLLRVQHSGRYERHPLVLQYSQEKLEADTANLHALQERHFAYFLALAKRARPPLKGPDQKAWLERLEQDHDNFRTSLSYALTCDAAEQALGLSGELWVFWNVRGHHIEGREWLGKALAQSGCSSTPERALALSGAGWLAMQQSDYQVANDLLVESLTIYRNLNQPRDIAYLLNHLAGIAYYFGDCDLATAYLKETLTICRTIEDERGVASALVNLGSLALEQGNLKVAYSLTKEALQISQNVGDKRLPAHALVQLGETAIKMENHSSARDLLERGLAVSRELDYKVNIAYACEQLGNLDRKEGSYNQSQMNYAQSLSLYQALGDQTGVTHTLEDFVHLFAQQRDWQRSVCLLGAAESSWRAMGTSRQLSEQPEFEKVCNELTAQLNKDTFSAIKDEGRRMTLEQAVAYALESTPGEAL